MALGRGDDLHFLPVVRKLFAAIQTADVSARERRSRGAASGAAHSDGKAVAGVSATKKDVHQLSDHNVPYLRKPRRAEIVASCVLVLPLCPSHFIKREPQPLTLKKVPIHLMYFSARVFRFNDRGKGLAFSRPQLQNGKVQKPLRTRDLRKEGKVFPLFGLATWILYGAVFRNSRTFPEKIRASGTDSMCPTLAMTDRGRWKL